MGGGNCLVKRAITAISVTGAAGVAYSVWATTVHLIVDDPPRMVTVHLVVLTTFAVGFVAACGWAGVLRLEAGQRRIVADLAANHEARMTRVETELAARSARGIRQYETLRTALVSLGAEVAENTGEIRRQAGGAIAVVPAARAWPAIDPATLRLMQELDQHGLSPRPRGIEQ